MTTSISSPFYWPSFFSLQKNQNSYKTLNQSQKSSKFFCTTKSVWKMPTIYNSFSFKNASIGMHFSQVVNQEDKKKEMIQRTATSRISCFAQKGNHPRRETLFRNYVVNRALLYKKQKKITVAAYFPTFFYAATPFIRLKTRRRSGRRKKLFQKVTFRSRNIGERQAYLFFAKSFRNSKKNAKNGSFWEMFRSQRENLFPVSKRSSKKKRIQKLSSPIVVSSSAKSVKTIREVRDDIHQRAFRMKPRYWQRKWKARGGSGHTKNFLLMMY